MKVSGSHGRGQIVRLLLQHGADAKIQNKHRETALDGAQGLTPFAHF